MTQLLRPLFTPESMRLTFSDFTETLDRLVADQLNFYI